MTNADNPRAVTGDNSAGVEMASTKFAKDQLKAIVERIERLEEEKATIASDIRDVYAEAKGNGFTPKVIRAIIRDRKRDPDEKAEFDAIYDTYCNALGIFG